MGPCKGLENFYRALLQFFSIKVFTYLICSALFRRLEKYLFSVVLNSVFKHLALFELCVCLFIFKAKKLLGSIAAPKTTDLISGKKEEENKPKKSRRRLYTAEISAPLDIPASAVSIWSQCPFANKVPPSFLKVNLENNQLPGIHVGLYDRYCQVEFFFFFSNLKVVVKFCKVGSIQNSVRYLGEGEKRAQKRFIS